MSNHCKLATTLLIAVLMASSLIMVESASAQSTPKPSVPEFTVSVTDHSYDVEPTTTTTTDPYDGQITTTTTPGYHMVNGSIEISIKNQPFTQYYNSDGFPIKLYYHIRAKGYDPVYWNYIPYLGSYLPATNSTYTTVTLAYSNTWFQTGGGFNSYRPDGTLDFQVEAFIGYKNVTNIHPWNLMTRQEDLLTEYVGQTSGWSDTQTVTIPNGAYTPTTPRPTDQTTPTPTDTLDNPTTTPSTHDNQPETNDYTPTSIPLTTFLLVTAVFIGIIAVLLILLFQRHKKPLT